MQLVPLFLGVLAIHAISIQRVCGDVFSSSAHLKLVQDAEPEVKELLKGIPDDEKQEKGVRKIIRLFQSTTSDLSHPIAAYLFVKRWSLLNAHEPRVVIFPEGLSVEAPTDYDLMHMGSNLLRLQRVYHISTEDMAAGKVAGHQSSDLLAADDFFELGIAAMILNDFGLAAQWLTLATTTRRQHETATGTQGAELVDLTEAYHQLAHAHSLIGDLRSALTAAEKASELDPRFGPLLKEVQDSIGRSKEDLNNTLTMYTWQKPIALKGQRDYERLCRGETLNIKPLSPKLLYCRYRSGGGGVKGYVRYKEEILSWSPRVSRLYDVISDSEIRQLKDLATPKLTRVAFGGNDLGDVHVGKDMHVSDSDSPLSLSLSRRVADITGLDVTTRQDRLSSAEDWKVVNYGIGGHFVAHHDYRHFHHAQLSDPPHLQNTGDRMVTFRFQLSDVIEGGATVFPTIGVRIPAEKNGAIFWYNASPSGVYDDNTLNAECPVLVGENWVANKYIREHGQAFRVPCHLDPHAIWS